MVRRRRGAKGTSRRDEVRGNSRMSADLAAKDEEIAGQGEEVSSQAEEIADLKRRIASLEGFRDREQGFAGETLRIANFPDGLITGAKLEGRTIGRNRVAVETLTYEEIAEGTIGHLRMDKASIRSWLDDVYAKK